MRVVGTIKPDIEIADNIYRFLIGGDLGFLSPTLDFLEHNLGTSKKKQSGSTVITLHKLLPKVRACCKVRPTCCLQHRPLIAPWHEYVARIRLSAAVSWGSSGRTSQQTTLLRFFHNNVSLLCSFYIGTKLCCLVLHDGINKLAKVDRLIRCSTTTRVEPDAKRSTTESSHHSWIHAKALNVSLTNKWYRLLLSLRRPRCAEIETPGRRHGEGCPLTIRGVWGSVVNSLRGVWGGAPIQNGFYAYLRSERSHLEHFFQYFWAMAGPKRRRARVNFPLSPCGQACPHRTVQRHYHSGSDALLFCTWL